MKNYAKVGNKKGKPAYRTPSNFKNSVGFRLPKIPKQNFRRKV